jgi:hypothetical protein
MEHNGCVTGTAAYGWQEHVQRAALTQAPGY